MPAVTPVMTTENALALSEVPGDKVALHEDHCSEEPRKEMGTSWEVWAHSSAGFWEKGGRTISGGTRGRAGVMVEAESNTTTARFYRWSKTGWFSRRSGPFHWCSTEEGTGMGDCHRAPARLMPPHLKSVQHHSKSERPAGPSSPSLWPWI